MSEKHEQHASLAWVGEDELGSGKVGIKQGMAPAGYVPLAAIDYHRDRMDKMKPQLEAQAKLYGKKIRLVEYRFHRVVDETEAGK